MARYLGTLTLDLVAKVGGFTQGMTEAERVADRKSREIARKQKQRAKEIENAWKGISRAITFAFAGFSFGATIQKVIQETRNFQNEQAQLEAVLRSTGEAAGFTKDQLNKMASEMERRSIFSAGEINQAQARLLSYSNIVGEQFPKAMQATIDMATRMGMDVKSAAETVGRALDSPKEGLTALQRQGFRFTEDQKALVERLQETGKTAEAQAIVLQALESSYGGAAAAARDTLGGAIAGLQNQLNSLLTGEGGSFDEATRAINRLTAQLASPEVQAAFAKFTGWIADLVSGFVHLSANMTEFLSSSNKLGIMFGTDALSKKQEEVKSLGRELENLTNRAIRMAGDLEHVQKGLSTMPIGEIADPDLRRMREGYDRIRGMIDDVRRKAKAANTELRKMVGGVVEGDTDPSAFYSMDSRLDKKPAPVPDAAGEAARQKAAEEAARLAKQQQQQAEQYLKQLKEQLVKTQDLTAFERLMYDIKEGNVVLAGKQLDQAEGLATAIDMAREREAQRALEIDRQNALYEAQNALMSRRNQYELELLTYGMGNREAAELRERISLMQQYQAQITKLEQDRALALAGADTEEERARIQAMYDTRLQIVRDTLSQELALHERAIAQRRLKEADWQAGAMAAARTYLEETQNLYEQTRQAVERAFGGMEDAIVDLVMTGKADFKSLAQSIISDLIRIEARALITKAAMSIFGISTGGGAVSILGSIFGFAEGGYTGPGGKNQPAGIVHAGEYVINADSTRKLGLDFLDRLNGYADGGYVGLPPVVTQPRRDDYVRSEPIVNIIEDPRRARQVEMTTNERGEEVLNVFVASIGSGGKAAKALEATYGLRRRGT